MQGCKCTFEVRANDGPALDRDRFGDVVLSVQLGSGWALVPMSAGEARLLASSLLQAARQADPRGHAAVMAEIATHVEGELALRDAVGRYEGPAQ